MLTYGHELLVEAAAMFFLSRVAFLSLRHRLKSTAIWRELRVESLLLHVEWSQMRWYGHLIRMPSGASIRASLISTL